MFSNNEPTLAGRAWERGYNNILVNNQQRRERLVRLRLITEPTETDHRPCCIASREVSLQYWVWSSQQGPPHMDLCCGLSLTRWPAECCLAGRDDHLCTFVASPPWHGSQLSPAWPAVMTTCVHVLRLLPDTVICRARCGWQDDHLFTCVAAPPWHSDLLSSVAGRMTTCVVVCTCVVVILPATHWNSQYNIGDDVLGDMWAMVTQQDWGVWL